VRVVIAGGGVAALEALLALRKLAEERVELELLAPEPHFWYRPLAVAEPFDVGVVQRVELVEIASAAGAAFTLGALASVDADAHFAWNAAGARFDYDALLVACGGRPEEALAGALTFRGPADAEHFRHIVQELGAGALRRLVFAVPSGVVWPLPLYELALMTAAALAGRGVDAELVLVTPEREPLQLFGPEASGAVASLLDDRRIAFRGGSSPLAYSRGRLSIAVGDDHAQELAADGVVALPLLRGVAIEGVPHDRDGFVNVDLHGRVVDSDGLYAAGDITSYPVKQGGLAAQQADAAAEAIAAAAGAPVTPTPFRPVLRGMILTGGIPRYLRTPSVPGEEAAVSVEPLWWPPTKIAAHHLSPYLAGRAASRTRTGHVIEVERELGPSPAPVRTAVAATRARTTRVRRSR
jgi:sulfide:quinone oxidoreductase